MSNTKRCKVCHARCLNLGPDGRCCGCRMALISSVFGISYGSLMARIYDANVDPDTVTVTGLPPVADNRKMRGVHWDGTALPDMRDLWDNGQAGALPSLPGVKGRR